MGTDENTELETSLTGKIAAAITDLTGKITASSDAAATARAGLNTKIATNAKNAMQAVSGLKEMVEAESATNKEAVEKEVATINKNVATINRTITAQVKMHWKVVRLVNAITNHMLSVLPANMDDSSSAAGKVIMDIKK